MAGCDSRSTSHPRCRGPTMTLGARCSRSPGTAAPPRQSGERGASAPARAHGELTPLPSPSALPATVAHEKRRILVANSRLVSRVLVRPADDSPAGPRRVPQRHAAAGSNAAPYGPGQSSMAIASSVCLSGGKGTWAEGPRSISCQGPWVAFADDFRRHEKGHHRESDDAPRALDGGISHHRKATQYTRAYPASRPLCPIAARPAPSRN